jgi:hypothetical protein
MHDRPKAKTEGVVSERIDDELVLYDQATQTAHCLSSRAALIWEHCDGRVSPAELAGRLALEPAAVRSALDALSERGLLDGGPVAAQPGYSRREAAARLAKAGGAAFAAPLIYSAAIPSMAAALSPNPACGTEPKSCTATQVPINSTHTAVGTAAPGGCNSLGAGCSATQGCGNFVNPSCCYGICAWTGTGTCAGALATYICSTQYGCVRRGTACPSTTATCSGNTCCSPFGKALPCAPLAGANFGCCSGTCSGGVCT